MTSLTNPTVKEIGLWRNEAPPGEWSFRCRGPGNSVTDAVEAGWPIRIFVHAEKLSDNEMVAKTAGVVHARGGLVLQVSEKVLEKITRRDNPQMVIGVFEQKLLPVDKIASEPGSVWIALEGIKDPGNLGTIVRTADAVGAAGVLLIGDTVDPFGTEAVRATMGSIFTCRSCAARPMPSRNGGKLAGNGGRHPSFRQGDYRQAAYDGPVLLLMGNEQSGLPEDMAALCDQLVKIPMAGKADSLNLAVSTAVMLYEIRREGLRL